MKNNNSCCGNKMVSTQAVGLLFCLLLSMLFSSCKTTEVLATAASADCGISTVYLSDWNSRASSGSPIVQDPVGGSILVYWVDEAGNACHGVPGQNGQVGPAEIRAYTQKAYDAFSNGASVTQENLKSLQSIPFSFESYAGSGLHFAQFYNVFFRAREDGKVTRVSSQVSIPNVIEVGIKSCMVPVGLRWNPVLVLPSTSSEQNSQDPGRCKKRVMPTAPAMSEADRIMNEAGKLQNGNAVYEVP